jgi:hypothetical protein
MLSIVRADSLGTVTPFRQTGLPMAKPNEWAGKVMALVKSGNTQAAIAQIKVAPSVKDLRAFQTAMAVAKLGGKWRDLDAAVSDNIALLSAPRLHRSP